VGQEPELLEQLLTAGGRLAAVGDMRLREAVALQAAANNGSGGGGGGVIGSPGACGAGGGPSVAATVKLLERAAELYTQV